MKNRGSNGIYLAKFSFSIYGRGFVRDILSLYIRQLRPLRYCISPAGFTYKVTYYGKSQCYHAEGVGQIYRLSFPFRIPPAAPTKIDVGN